MYNITEGTKAAPGNELGIFEDLGDVYSQEDLDFFWLWTASLAIFQQLGERILQNSGY